MGRLRKFQTCAIRSAYRARSCSRRFTGLTNTVQDSGPARQDLPSATFAARHGPLRRSARFRVPPAKMVWGGQRDLEARPDKIFLLITHNDSAIHIEPTDPLSISRRMIFCIRCERLGLTSQYLASTFASPGVRNSFLETAYKLEGKILDRALAGKEAYTVRHPYPVSLDRLFEAMKPFVEQRA